MLCYCLNRLSSFRISRNGHGFTESEFTGTYWTDKSKNRKHGKNQIWKCDNWRIPLFITAKCLDHEDFMNLIEKLRNLPGVEEVKTQLVLDRIKEDTTIIIPE